MQNCIVIFFTLVTLYVQSDGNSDEESFIEETRNIKELIALLHSEDENIRIQAFEDLLQLEKEKLLPHIVEALESSESSLLFRLYNKLQGNIKYIPPVRPLSLDEAFERLRMLKITSKEERNYYVLKKSSEIEALIKTGDLARAIKLLDAISILETGAIGDSAYKTMVALENIIFINTTLEPALELKETVYVEGNSPAFDIKLKNKSNEKISLSFPPEVTYNLILKVNITEYDLVLNKSYQHLPFTRKIEDIEIEPGKEWSQTIEINELTKFSLSKDVAIVEIETLFIPGRLTIGGRPVYKKIMLPKQTFLMVREKHKDLLTDTANKFTELMKTGSVEDVFVVSLVCAFAGNITRELAINTFVELIKSIDNKTNPVPYNLIRNILKLMTGKDFKKAKDWLNWWVAEKSKDENDKHNKK